MTRVQETTPRPADAQDRRFRILSAVLAVALVLALAVAAWLFVQKRDADDRADKAGRSATELSHLQDADLAARDLLVDMTTYDYQHVDDMYDWLDQLASSDVKKQTASNEKKFEKIVRLTRASAKGEVQESAYRPGPEDGSVVVILFVHQTITDRTNQKKTEDQWATFTMVPGQTKSGWVAKDIQLSGVPNPDGTVTQR